MTTLYYRFKGAPEMRVGGPWWHKEFTSRQELEVFRKDVEFFCDAVEEEADHDCRPGCRKDYPAPPHLCRGPEDHCRECGRSLLLAPHVGEYDHG
jgi:hypothetical protein